ncbi:unnamed protein product [Polarella glacialis]|uniref:Uncharacterized protein n=1 Tax=Polarella glacialis TaxID=89957 RepID=A0A813FB67_POLGL|nr:unnamed protein product [Polarella glacialis]
MSYSGATFAVAGLVGLSLAPAFVLPSTRQGTTQAALRGVAAPSAPAAQAQSLSAPAVAGVLGVAAIVSVASRKPSARGAAKVVVACKAFDASAQVGATAPIGFFDPAGFTKDCDEAKWNNLRRAEIKHGRAAMMACLGLLVQSLVKLPGYEDVPAGLAAQWTAPGSSTLAVVFFLIGSLEIGLSPWSEDTSKPGDHGDPCNFGNYTLDMRNKELNNGRMAMFAWLGIVSAEYYTGTVAVGQFATAQPGRASPTMPGFCGVSSPITRNGRAQHCSRQAFDGASQAGASAPLGYFDPLRLGQNQERFDKFRASEVKHGRVAMMAILGTFGAHWGHAPNIPVGMAGFSDTVWGGANGVVAITLAAGLLELGPWQDATAIEPGNFGDPASFAKDLGSARRADIPQDVYDKDIKTKELNNGRLAMLATMGMIAAELTTGERVTDLPSQLGL